MRYVAPALWAEGRSDHRFLRPLLLRVINDVVLRTQDRGDMLIATTFVGLVVRDNERTLSRAERIACAVEREVDAVSLLFIHADADQDAAQARHERVIPAFEEVRQRLGSRAPALVALVPVRETEAWMLADEEALASAFGVTRSAIGSVPEIGTRVERLTDPKQTLRELTRRVIGSRAGRQGYLSYLDDLGERIELNRLRRLAAFRTFEAELATALRSPRVIP